MFFVIKAKELKRFFSDLARFLPNKLHIPAVVIDIDSENNSIFLQTSSIEKGSLRVKVNAERISLRRPVKVAMPFDLLYKAVERFSRADEEMELSFIINDRITIKGGEAEIKVVPMPIDSVPIIEGHDAENKDFFTTLPCITLAEKLYEVLPALQYNNKPEYDAVKMTQTGKRLHLFAVTPYRVSWRWINTTGDAVQNSKSIVLPKSIAMEIFKIIEKRENDMVDIYKINDSMALFKLNGSGVSILARLMIDKIIDPGVLIKKFANSARITAVVGIKRFYTAVDIASITAGVNPKISLSISNGKMTVQSEDEGSEFGTSKDVFECEASDNISVKFNPVLISEVLRTLKDKKEKLKLNFVKPNDILLMTGEGHLDMIAPIVG